MPYNAKNWCWIVAGSTTQVYSGATASYVGTSDATYLAWKAAGNRPTAISANDMVLLQIDVLEQSVTTRMLQEAASGSTLTGLGPDQNLTSAQFIASVRSQIATLRAAI